MAQYPFVGKARLVIKEKGSSQSKTTKKKSLKGYWREEEDKGSLGEKKKRAGISLTQKRSIISRRKGIGRKKRKALSFLGGRGSERAKEKEGGGVKNTNGGEGKECGMLRNKN